MSLDPKQLKLAAKCETPGILFALARDTNAELLYAAGTDRAVYSVDPTAEKPEATKRWTNHESYVSALATLGESVVSGGFDHRLIWTDAKTGEARHSIEAHAGWVRDVAVLPGETPRIVSVGDDMLVKVWDASSAELFATLNGHEKQTPQGYATALYAVAVTPDGKTIASGDRTGTVCLWDVATKKLIRQLKAPEFYTYDPIKRVRSIGGIRSLRFSPDGERLAIGGIGQVTNVDGFVGPCRVELWDWRAGKRVFASQDKHQAVFNDLAFHPSEPWLAAGGGGDSGGILALWHRETGKLVHKVKPEGHLQRIAWNAAGDRLDAAGYGGLQFWGFGGETPDKSEE